MDTEKAWVAVLLLILVSGSGKPRQKDKQPVSPRQEDIQRKYSSGVGYCVSYQQGLTANRRKRQKERLTDVNHPRGRLLIAFASFDF